MITVNFYTTLRLMLALKEIQVECTGDMSVPELLQKSEVIVENKTSKKFIWKLLEEDGAIKLGTIIMINGKNILDSDGLGCRIKDGETVALFPPGGGG